MFKFKVMLKADRNGHTRTIWKYNNYESALWHCRRLSMMYPKRVYYVEMTT